MGQQTEAQTEVQHGSAGAHGGVRRELPAPEQTVPGNECWRHAAIALELNDQRLTVRMEVLERSPYTTLIRLSQHPDAPWNHGPA